MNDVSVTASQDRAGVEAGERLKSARESKNLTVRQVAERLHLDPWAIEALESGRFEALGPPVYIKGHLHKYAALLGQDPASVASICEAQNASNPQLAPFSLSVKMKKKIKMGGRPRRIVLIVLALVVLIAAGALAGWLLMHS